MKLTIIGNGYTAKFLAKDALKDGYEVSIITRNISNPKKNINYVNFLDSNNVKQKLTNENIVSTVPFNDEGFDPVLKKYGKSIERENLGNWLCWVHWNAFKQGFIGTRV